MTALLEEEARENCEPEPSRIVLTPENIAARGRSTRAIHAKQAVVEEPRRMRRVERVVRLPKQTPSEYGGKLRGLPRTPRWIPATA